MSARASAAGAAPAEGAPRAPQGARQDGGALTLFRVRGVPVRVERSWIPLFVFVLAGLSLGWFPAREPELGPAACWVAGLAATLLLFASVLLHELAHVLAAQRAGVPVQEVGLFLFGGVSRMTREAASPRAELVIALVGPLASFALALAFWLLGRATGGAGPWSAIVAYIASINLALGLFNLLPGFPLDGGRALRAIVWRRTGSLRRATRVASSVGQAFAIALMLLGALQILGGFLVGGLWTILVATFVHGLARRAYDDLLVRTVLSDVEVARVMVPRERLQTVPPTLSLRELVDDCFLARGYRGYPVMEDGRAIGLVTLDDVRRVAKEEWARTRVGDVMSPLDERIRIAPDAKLLEALKRFTQSRHARLLVMRDGELEGLLSSGGISRHVELRSLVQEG